MCIRNLKSTFFFFFVDYKRNSKELLWKSICALETYMNKEDIWDIYVKVQFPLNF